MKIKQILKTKLIPIALVAITLLLLLNTTALAADSWTPVASMSDKRVYFQTEVIDGKIYAIGGGYDSYLSSVEMYDPAINTWTPAANMSTPRSDFRTVVVNGRIYAIGGRESSVNYLSSMEVYDPATNTWTMLANMSSSRIHFEATVVNNKIYVIGGQNSSGTLSTVEVYDLVNNTWTTLSSMSTARCWFQAQVIDEKIYAVGGIGNSYLSSVEVYDTCTDTWTTLADMSTSRAKFEAEVIDNDIYVFGGLNHPYTISAVEVYDPTTNTWTSLASMNTPRFFLQTVVIDGKVYALGGLNVSTLVLNTEVYDPATNTWDNFDSLSSEGRGAFEAEIISNTIYVIGGLPASSVSSVEAYTVTTTPDDPIPDDPTDGNALLRITMITGESKEYDMSASAVNAFTSWYNSGGAGSPSYSIAKNYNIGSLSGRTDNIAFKKIAFFEVMAYNTSSTPDTNTKTALLKVTMATDDVMEYEMNAAEISAFESWYDGGASGTPAYSINKNFNIGPFASRTDYLAHDMISDYEIITF